MGGFLDAVIEEYQIQLSPQFSWHFSMSCEAQGGIAQLAKQTDLDPHIVSEILSSEDAPPINSLRTVLNALGCRTTNRNLVLLVKLEVHIVSCWHLQDNSVNKLAPLPRMNLCIMSGACRQLPSVEGNRIGILLKAQLLKPRSNQRLWSYTEDLALSLHYEYLSAHKQTDQFHKPLSSLSELLAFHPRDIAVKRIEDASHRFSDWEIGLEVRPNFLTALADVN